MKKSLFFFILTLIISNAEAAFGPITFTPATPNSNDVVSLQLLVGGCDAFVSIPSGFSDPEISIAGSIIRITKMGISTDDFAACINPVAINTVPLRSFPAGAFQVELYLRQAFMQTSVRLVQTGSLTIVQAPFRVEQVPSNSPIGLGALIVLMLLAVWAIGRRAV